MPEQRNRIDEASIRLLRAHCHDVEAENAYLKKLAQDLTLEVCFLRDHVEGFEWEGQTIQ